MWLGFLLFSMAANEARSSGEVTESVTDVLSWNLVLGCLLSIDR